MLEKKIQVSEVATQNHTKQMAKCSVDVPDGTNKQLTVDVSCDEDAEYCGSLAYNCQPGVSCNIKRR